VSVDFTDKPALAAVFKQHKVDVLICAVPSGGWPAQIQMAEAAKDAGVKLFVPSEFGLPTEGHKEGALALKSQVAGSY
jgi:NmrA-like family